MTLSAVGKVQRRTQKINLWNIQWSSKRLGSTKKKNIEGTIKEKQHVPSSAGSANVLERPYSPDVRRGSDSGCCG